MPPRGDPWGPGRVRLATVAAAAPLLLWPTLLHGGHPYLFWDTYGYFTQGRDHWTVLLALLGLGPVPPEAAQGWVGAVGRIIDYDPTVRSPTYAALLWPLAALGGFLLPCLLAAAAAAYAVDVALDRLFGLDLPRRLPVLAGLAALSPLPWFASYAMPDLFGGLMVLAMATLAFAWERLARGQRAAMAALALLGASFHAANLPLAAGLAVAGALLSPAGRRLATAARLTAPLAGAVAVLLALGWLGFGKASVAPKTAPFLLARQVEDGPALPYLREACARGEDWALCPHAGALHANAQDFLWHERDSFWAWDEATRDRLRAEEGRLVLRAALARPFTQAAASARNALRQLAHFGLDDLVVGRGAVVVPGDYWYDYMEGSPAQTYGLRPFTAAVYASTALALAAIPWLAPSRAALFLLAGVALNAAACGALSGPHARYQARVVWLVPLAAGALLAGGRWRAPAAAPTLPATAAAAP